MWALERKVRRAQHAFAKQMLKASVFRRRKRRAARKYRISSVFSRYREKELPGYGRNIIAGVTKLGVFTRRLNNVIDMVQTRFATGSAFEASQLIRTWDQVNPGPPFNSGGPFKSISYRVPTCELTKSNRYLSSQFPGFQPRSDWEYKGAFSCGNDWGTDLISQYTNTSLASFSSLSGYHSQAWDKLKPRVAKAGVSQFIYELRDLPRQLVTSANLFHNSWKQMGGGYGSVLMSPTNVAENFLNHNFGWVPFISDLMSMYSTYQRSHEIIAQSVRDNGQWMRRMRVLEETETIVPIKRIYGSDTEPNQSTNPMDQMCSTMVVDGIPCKGLTDILVHDKSRVWAVGSFRSYRPEFDDRLRGFTSPFTTVQQILTIYGARINPTVLWKITPWSWMVDWFTGVGRFIERYDDFIQDGITSRYLYVMKQSSHTVSKTCMINFSGSGPVSFEWRRNLALKQREVADSPYGFNVPWNSLSAKQWAILGAIGILQTNSGFVVNDSRISSGFIARGA
jgi:hypothetical protein